MRTWMLALALTLAFAARAAEPDAARLAGLRAAAPRDRIAAALALRTAPAPGAEAIPALIEALGDDYFEVRWTALLLLERLGAAAVPALTRTLSDASFHRRWGAARALGDIGAAAAPAVPALAQVFASGEIDVRVEAGRALLAIGRTDGISAAAVTALNHPVSDVRELAVALLGRAGKDAVKEITGLLDGPDLEVRRSAAHALGAIGPDAASAVPSVMKLLRDELAVTQQALAGLRDGGIRDSQLRHRTADQPAIFALGRMGAAAVPPMLGLLKDDDELTLVWAARVLGRLGPVAAPAAREMAAAFRRTTAPRGRATLAETLGVIGGASTETAAVLREGLGSPDEWVRRACATSLAKLNAVAALADAVKDGPPASRKLAIQTLAGMGSAAKAALPALQAAAKDADPEVRAAAEAAVQAVTPRP